MSIPSDTSIDIDRVQLDLLRQKSPHERAMIAVRLTDEVRLASRRAIARANPEFTPRQIEYCFIELHYGRELADAVRNYDEARANGPSE